MHGNSLLKIGAIVGVNYAIAKLGGSSRAMPALTWIFNIGILFMNEKYRGYNFTDMHSSLAWLVSHAFVANVERLFLEQFTGSMGTKYLSLWLH
jgi:hypothetical protein